MHDTAKVITYGTLLAKGTRENPIVFRGDRPDFILNDILPYDRTPSQWGRDFLPSGKATITLWTMSSCETEKQD